MQRRRMNSLIPGHLNLRKIVSVGAGSYHSFAIDECGRTYAWGLNNYAQVCIAGMLSIFSANTASTGSVGWVVAFLMS